MSAPTPRKRPARKPPAPAPEPGTAFAIDPSTLTFLELEAFYEATGLMFDEAVQPVERSSVVVDDDGQRRVVRTVENRPTSPRTMPALLWLAMRRDDPSVSFDDVMGMPMQVLSASRVNLAVTPDPSAARSD